MSRSDSPNESCGSVGSSKPIGDGHKQRFIVIAAIGTCLLAAAAYVRFGGGDHSRDSQLDEFPLPPVSQSRFLNTTPEATYIGTERCRDCHQDQFQSYSQTAHSLAMSEVVPEREPPDGQFDHEPSHRRYRIYRQDGQLRHRESLLLDDGAELELSDFPLKYLVGSGRFSRTYLVETDGFLVESPVTWYTSLGQWRMSPGYDAPIHESFRRMINPECLYCHTTRVEMTEGSSRNLRLHELAIGCERCHGPGSLHEQHHRQHPGAGVGDAGEDLTIVNPKYLSRELSESVCHQCHLHGVARIPVRGRAVDAFRPGLPWQEFQVDYGYQDAHGKMTVVGHAEQLHLSRCYQQSDALTCTTCHDPHNRVEPQNRAAHYRLVCLSCHQDQQCGIASDERIQQNANDCASCHMPASSTDIPHIAFTHHRVGVHRVIESESEETAESSAGNPLAPLLGVSHLPDIEQRRMLGLAYLRVFKDNANSERFRPYRGQAEALLLEVAAEGLADNAACVSLAHLAAMSDDFQMAKNWLEQIQDIDDSGSEFQIGLLLLSSHLYIREQRFDASALTLKRLVGLRRAPDDWFLLGMCQEKQSQRQTALDAYLRSAKIDPSEPHTHEAAANVARALGHRASAAEHERRSMLLRRTIKSRSNSAPTWDH